MSIQWVVIQRDKFFIYLTSSTIHYKWITRLPKLPMVLSACSYWLCSHGHFHIPTATHMVLEPRPCYEGILSFPRAWPYNAIALGCGQGCFTNMHSIHSSPLDGDQSSSSSQGLCWLLTRRIVSSSPDSNHSNSP